MLASSSRRTLNSWTDGFDHRCIVTQTQVDAADPAFMKPTKFVGPVYGFKEAEALASQPVR